ncbi:MAG TPA: RDD family protein [Thermoanaerobaculia bacterium]
MVVRLSAGVSVWPFWKPSAQATPMLTGVELVLEILLWVGYGAAFESSQWQATLGKRALSLRVTDLAGRRISFGRAVARQFAEVLSWLTLTIGFLMAGFTRRRQALHDMVAGTLVIRDLGSGLH